MYSISTSSSTSQLLQDFLPNFHSRKLLLHYTQSNQSSAPPPYPQNSSFDQNVLMVLSIILLGLIFSLGLNLIIRCVLRCSNGADSESIDNSSAAIVKMGIETKALKTFPVVNYSAEMNLPGLDSECLICCRSLRLASACGFYRNATTDFMFVVLTNGLNLTHHAPNAGIVCLKHAKKSWGVIRVAH
ncbi:hypothetical protein CXB51_003964 [Gossypium anomalum]|uniref:RING-type E3 ubiquitin transferase n=1 Tax=Gossypium anomalum TaxID=47600 RepID=A0A8J5ZQ14_9ROSI|nr:hypothetical protein CXB51_003964 [Gossypium anomalum]